MELHGYLSIAVTLFYTATLLHLAGGLTTVIKKESAYSVHILSIFAVFLYTIQSFWTTWAHNNVEWTSWKFFVAIVEPALYYFLAAILIPNDAKSVKSWKIYFYKVKNKYYFVLLLLLINIQTSGFILLELNPFTPSQLPALFGIIPLIIALKSNKHIIHLVIMILYIAMGLLIMSTIGYQPGWLLNQ